MQSKQKDTVFPYLVKFTISYDKGMDLKEVLSTNIKALRKLYGLTQASLAEAMKCSHSTIRDYENHVSFPGPEMLESLALALRVEASELLKQNVKPAHAPVSKTLQKMMCIPDKVYDLAMDLDGDKETWDIIEGIMEEQLTNKKKSKVKT